MKFSIKFSKESELERVLWTKERFKWYLENKYDLKNFVLPGNIKVEEFDLKSETEIREYINKEYSEEFFQPHVQIINTLLREYLNKLTDYFSEIKIEVLPEIEIELTRYGVGR